MTTNYFWTRAPGSYDYPSCTSVALDEWRDRRGNAGWRLVKIEDNERTHGFAATQCDRYRSGFYAVLDAFDAEACERQGLLPMVRTITMTEAEAREADEDEREEARRAHDEACADDAAERRYDSRKAGD